MDEDNVELNMGCVNPTLFHSDAETLQTFSAMAELWDAEHDGALPLQYEARWCRIISYRNCKLAYEQC